MRAVSGPGRVPGRSARRLGRAGCRRGGGEGPWWVVGIGRGTGPPAFPIGAPTATAPAPSTGPSSASPATKPSPTRPSGGSLDDKMNSLFGRRMSDEEKAAAKDADKKKAPAK